MTRRIQVREYRHILPGKITDIAIDVEMSTEIVRKVPGDMQ
ncbi:MAG: hypothetical protein ACMUIM_00760 [bacterium]